MFVQKINQLINAIDLEKNHHRIKTIIMIYANQLFKDHLRI